MDIFELHEIIDKTELDLAEKFNCHVTIHLDPVDVENEQLTELKQLLAKTTTLVHPNLTAHDVRMVPGKEHTNLIFDVVKPFDCTLSDTELKEKITKLIRFLAEQSP